MLLNKKKCIGALVAAAECDSDDGENDEAGNKSGDDRADDEDGERAASVQEKGVETTAPTSETANAVVTITSRRGTHHLVFENQKIRDRWLFFLQIAAGSFTESLGTETERLISVLCSRDGSGIAAFAQLLE